MATLLPTKEKRLRVVLAAPRIAENVASIVRSVHAMDGELHLVGPFGFILDKKRLKRSSVGYWDELQPVIYKGPEDFWESFDFASNTEIYFATKNGSQAHSSFQYSGDICIFFGNEEEGIPQNFWDVRVLDRIKSCRIPTTNVRCLNLGVSVAIIGFEVRRQWDMGSDVQIHKVQTQMKEQL